MGRLPWYKAEPGAFFHATRGWRGELKCVYRTVLDLIYWHEGGLPDDDGYVAGQLGYQVRVWKRLRNELIGLGKLYVEDGHIRNHRADAEVVKALSKLDQTAKAGSRGGNSRVRVEKGISEPESNDSNDKTQADAQADFKQTLDLRLKSQKEDSESSARPPVPATPSPTARATLWREMKGWVGGSHGSAGKFLGLQASRYGEGQLVEGYFAARKADPQGDRRAYLTGLLQRQAGTRGTDRSPMASYQRVKAMMANGDPYAGHDVSHLLALMPSETVQ